jgi:hypothetical protein
MYVTLKNDKLIPCKLGTICSEFPQGKLNGMISYIFFAA